VSLLQQGSSSSEPRTPSKSNATNQSLIQALQEAVVKKRDQQQGEAYNGVEELFRSIQQGLEPLPEGFPPGPPNDSALELVQDPVAFILKVSREYGGIAGLRLAGQKIALVTDPILAKDVMIDRPQFFQKDGTAFFPNSSMAGNGLLVSDGDVWRRQRRLSNPAFRKAAVDSYSSAMVDAAKQLINERWQVEGVRDVYADFNDLSLTIVVSALFGSTVDRKDDLREIRDAIADAFEFFAKRAGGGMAVPEWVPTQDNLRFTSAVRRLRLSIR